MSKTWTVDSHDDVTFYYSNPIHTVSELREAMAELKFLTGKEHVELSDENVIMIMVTD